MPVKSAFRRSVVLGLDDTDMPGTRGTGRLARMLAARLEEANIGAVHGVTRHQLYEGPGVPKTSHNSAAAIVLSDADPVEVRKIGLSFLEQYAADGSDPGIAIISDRMEVPVYEFAERAQRRLVDQVEARVLASTWGVFLRGLAGTEDGVIGALAAAALRCGGQDGRFVGLPGIRDLHGRMTVEDILTRSAVAVVVDQETGRPLAGSQVLDTRDWIRPRVVHHLPVVLARREGGGWVHADIHPGPH